MFKRFLIGSLIVIIVTSMGIFDRDVEAASPIGVKWGNSILIKGQIGKLTILKDTDLLNLKNGKTVVMKRIKKGSEYRVYSYKDQNGGIYGLGGGAFVKKNVSYVKYETPSKDKKVQLTQVLFFDKELLTLARKGFLKGSPIGLNDYQDLTDVYDYYNRSPEWIGYYNGGLGRKFGQYTYFTGDEYDNYLTAITWTKIGKASVTPALLRNALGKPTDEGIDNMDDTYYMYYDCGLSSLLFNFKGGSKSELAYILFKKHDRL